MKKYIALILFIFTVALAQAQEENGEIKTLFGDKHISHGGYGAVSVNYSRIDGKDAILMGGRGAWIINHGIALGFAGAGFLNDYHYNDQLQRNVNLAGGYGGLLLEPILFAGFPVHISLPVMAGVGGVAYTSSYDPYDWEDSHYFVEEATSFLVLEPGVEIELNMVKFFRLSVGGYYRLTSNVRMSIDPALQPDVLEGFSGGITLKFGKF